MTKRFSLKGAVLVIAVAMCTVLTYGQALAGGLAKIAEGVYSYAGASNASPQNSVAANAGIVVGEDGILVVDTLVSAKAAKEFIGDIREVSDKPIKYVVDTHGHFDHAFGNSEFEKLGAVIVAHKDCEDYLQKFGEAALEGIAEFGLTEEDIEGTQIAYPSITFTDTLRIDLGGRTVELLYPGPTHSPGSIMVYVPGEKVLFAGDMLFTDFHPFLGEGDLEAWQEALDFMKSLGAEKIIPGHGPVSGEEDVDDMKAYLAAFDARARELAAESDDIGYIYSELLKSLPKRAMGESLIKWNIQFKYLVKE